MTPGLHRLIALSLLSIAPLGCGAFRSVKKAYEPHVQAVPVLPIMAVAYPVPASGPAAKGGDGSLWSPEQSGNLFADDKAFRRGDIILVKVVQKSTASKTANTDSARKSSISANIQYALGLEKAINKLTHYTNMTSTTDASGKTTTATGPWSPNDLINATSGRAYSGQGSTSRDDQLQATVSAVVTEVMSNGNLAIYGHQTVQLNNEATVLTVQGIVRPSDLAADNSIDSSRVANANIQFNGNGVVSDPQQPGWGTRTFDWFWPF